MTYCVQFVDVFLGISVAGWCINAVLLAVLKVTVLDGFIIVSVYRS